MSKENLVFIMSNPELNKKMVRDAYEIMDKIERLESIENDDSSGHKRRQAAVKEKAFQQEDLEELKLLMKNNRSGFTRIIYYRYIEGYTSEEVAQEFNLSYNTVANYQANFAPYLKQPIKQSSKKRLDAKVILKKLEELINPKYTTSCTHCGCTTEIPHELANEIFNAEMKMERKGLREGRKKKRG